MPTRSVAATATGAVEAVVAAMQAFEDVAGVQIEGAGALLQLAQEPSVNSQMATLGAIDVVVLAMFSCPSNVNVQDQCCRTLTAFMKLTANNTKAQQCGAIDTVIAVRPAPITRSLTISACAWALAAKRGGRSF